MAWQLPSPTPLLAPPSPRSLQEEQGQVLSQREFAGLARLSCKTPTGHWVAALPHTKLRGLQLRPQGFPKPHLTPPGTPAAPAGSTRPVWLLTSPHSNNIHFGLPCSFCKPSHSSLRSDQTFQRLLKAGKASILKMRKRNHGLKKKKRNHGLDRS